MTLEEPKKQIADDESEMMEVKHAKIGGDRPRETVVK